MSQIPAQAQDAQVAQERQQAGHLVRIAAQRGERRLARVRRLRVELGADQHLAALGLRDVAQQLRAGDDRPEALRVVVRHERLERVGPDRQAHAGVARHLRDPAADRAEDDPGGDRPVRCLDPDDAVAVADEARDRGVLEDVDAALRGPGRVGPGDAVVPRGRRPRWCEAPSTGYRPPPVRSSCGTSSLSSAGVTITVRRRTPGS